MFTRLYKTALVTSPIIAIYGLAPAVFLTTLSWERIMIGFFSLSILIFAFWLINIYYLKQKYSPNQRYLLSIGSSFILHTVIIYLIPDFPPVTPLPNFMLYTIIATFAINSIILIIINSEMLRQEKEQAKYELQEVKVKGLEAQKKVLIQQLQPHFLFNALSTLKSLINENPDDASDYSVKLSEFLRYSIQSHTNELVSVKEELQFATDYIGLQKVRFGDALVFQIDIPDCVLHKQIPVFALQTLLENAIKHNTFTEKKPLTIEIGLEQKRIKVSNNKHPKPLVQKTGTGLQNLAERYRLAANQDIEINNTDSRFIVYLNLLNP